MEVGGVTYQAMLIADSVQHNKIRRSGKSDGRCLYNGGTIFIDDLEYHFTGGFHPRVMLKQLVGKIQTVTGLGNHLEAILYCLELFGSIIRL